MTSYEAFKLSTKLTQETGVLHVVKRDKEPGTYRVVRVEDVG